MFKRLFNSFSVSTVLATAFLFSACAAEQDEPGEELASIDSSLSKLPTIPAALAVPEGNRLGFVLYGDGVQIYDCKLGAAGALAWVFRAPEADLLWHGHVVGTHYVGPTWEGRDGSTVVGTRVNGVSVDASAIPWLLLQGTAHTGSGPMAKVTYIQRLETVGGLAPTSGCDDAHAGAVAEVEYTATYAFYEASNCGKH
jgi:hypothetical protein